MKNKWLIFLLMTPPFATAAVQKFSPAGGTVEFLAIGKPSFIKIHGTGAATDGSLALDGDQIKGTFSFELASLNTGIATRDEHMKNKYLEVEKYPQAQLELKSVKPLTGWSLAHPQLSKAEFDGVLTLHGQSQPVKGQVSIDDHGAVDVQFKIKLTDFKVDIPTFAGVHVADDVDVNVKIEKLKALAL